MTRTAYTDELKAEIARRLRFGFTMNEIAETLAIPLYGLRTAVRKHDIVSKEEMARLKAKRTAEHNKTDRMRRAMSRNLKRKWRDRAYRKEMIANLDEWSAETRATFGERVRERHAVNRGFHIPDDKRQEYDRLCDIYKMTSREAGVALGIIRA